jgi:DNA helicase-2/ATP-dependent DNA helicase PcrA
VLYRSHFHALELQLELTKRNIPFSITSGMRFFEQAHVKDVAAYLKLVANPRDELSFKRLVQLLPGIGGKGADKLWRSFAGQESAGAGNPKAETRRPKEGRNPKVETGNLAAAGGTAQEAAAGSPSPLPSPQGEGERSSALETSGPAALRQSLAVALQSCAGGVPKKAAVGWAQFVATIAQLEAEGVRENASEMIGLVIEAGYEDYLEESYANYRSRVEDLEQLAVFARQFPTVEDFLTQLALLTNLEAEDGQAASTDEERLRLSTIHQAKGLEFDVVFVIMLCDGLFPSERSLETDQGEEEERRLLYVAITRARNELYLSYPLVRAGYGGSGDTMQRPSRFLDEIPADLVEEWELRLGMTGME